MTTIKITVSIVLLIVAIGCTPKPKPSFFGVSIGERYQSAVDTNCDANLAFELEGHDRKYTCQISPPVPNPLFDSYEVELSLTTRTLFRIIASTQDKSGCKEEEAVKELLKSKYGSETFADTGRVWVAPGGVIVHLKCVKTYISPKDMTPEQYASIHRHVEFAEMSCIADRAVNKQRCIDNELDSQLYMALFTGGAWPTIDDHLSLSYLDEDTELKVANPEYRSLKRAYLTQHEDAKGL